jgi:flagellar hook-associated protein 1 FlgK|tara:strand:- start:96441 stop:98177 length:1737 start_codon:yes stop_codon:yes gene_type:complete
MSLIGALNNTFAGLKDTEARLNVTAQNVTNADRPGYTRKVYNSEYVSTDSATLPSGGTIDSAYTDRFLEKTLIEDTSYASYNSKISDYLSNYADQLGKISSESTISSAVNGILTAFGGLAVTPEDDSLKTDVVNQAQRLAGELSGLSGEIQDLRTRTEQEIAQNVEEINTALTRLGEINIQITLTGATGRSVAELEDQRRVVLEGLAENIDITSFIDSSNQLKVYAGSRPLLDSSAHQIEFTPATTVGSTSLYPGGFSPIDLNGTDMTTLLKGGELGGLIELRDTLLVEEQEKLDEFADVLREQLNTVLSEGASYASRSNIVGDEQGFALGDALGATGSVRIALTDTLGAVQNFADFNLAGYATINDMIVDMNATFAGDIVAALDANGSLTFTSGVAGQGVSLNQLDGDISGENFSKSFGLNNLFTGEGAEDLKVSSYLLDNNSFLATSRLSNDPALVVGDIGLNPGDGSLAQEMNDAFNTLYSFNAAGNFAGQTETLDTYVDKIIANIAVRANNASEEALTTTLILEQTKTTLENLTGVNVDEEMANLLDLEAKYSASARMMATIQEMFDELINAVR